MKQLLCIALLAVGLAGCGGGSSTPAVPSPFAGSWAGIANLQNGQSGPGSNVTLSVDSKGGVAGTWSDSSGNGSVTGSVTNAGDATLTFGATNSQPFSAHGVTAIAQTGDWTGSLTVQNGPAAGGSVALDVKRQ